MSQVKKTSVKLICPHCKKPSKCELNFRIVPRSSEEMQKDIAEQIKEQPYEFDGHKLIKRV